MLLLGCAPGRDLPEATIHWCVLSSMTPAPRSASPDTSRCYKLIYRVEGPDSMEWVVFRYDPWNFWVGQRVRILIKN
jgi:hypothetical protein